MMTIKWEDVIHKENFVTVDADEFLEKLFRSWMNVDNGKGKIMSVIFSSFDDDWHGLLPFFFIVIFFFY